MYINHHTSPAALAAIDHSAIGTGRAVAMQLGVPAGAIQLNLPVVTVTRETTLAYCAGLFDGDGAVIISRQRLPGRKNPTYRLTLSLVQNCYFTIKRFRDVIAQPHCLVEIRRKKQHNRQIYDLRYDGRHALAALELMLPYLVRKEIEARVAFDFYKEARMGVLPGPKGLPPEVWKIRDRYFKKMRDLK